VVGGVAGSKDVEEESGLLRGVFVQDGIQLRVKGVRNRKSTING
jgi:hypothetical protein